VAQRNADSLRRDQIERLQEERVLLVHVGKIGVVRRGEVRERPFADHSRQRGDPRDRLRCFVRTEADAPHSGVDLDVDKCLFP